MNLWLIFLTGLTTGGLSCLAVQGGLLTSFIANQKEQELEELDKDKQKLKKKEHYLKTLQRKHLTIAGLDQLDWLPVTMFLVAKIISHTLLGLLLGALGSVITLSLSVRLIFQTFTALFMFATAMNLLDVHPIFRYLAFQPPKSIRKMIKNTSRNRAVFAPFVLGLMTIFIPCGVTQAMEVLAIGSGNAWTGGLIMLAFTLGTSPLFALVGIATAKLSETWNKQFSKLAAWALVGMAIYSLNGVLLVARSPLTVQNLTKPITYFFSDERFTIQPTADSTPVENGVQKVRINIFSQGYSPQYIKVKKDIPVELTLASNDTYSCASFFVLKEFNISASLAPTDTKTFTFTPTKTGKFTFTCSMGMYSGTIEVI